MHNNQNSHADLIPVLQAIVDAIKNDYPRIYKAGSLTPASPITTAGISTTVLTVPSWVKAGTRIRLLAALYMNTGGTQSDYFMEFKKNGTNFSSGASPIHQQAGSAWVGSFTRFATTTVNPGDVITIVYGRSSSNATASVDSWYELMQVFPDTI